MKALLLSAGFGTRLRPITNTIPKCLVSIQGKPLLDYWLELLLEQGIERVLVNTHYLSTIVTEHIEQSSWADRVDTTYEKVLLGTGGTLKSNADYFAESSFLVAHADNLVRFNLDEFIEKHNHRPNGVHITMMTFTTDNPQSCGIIEEDNSGIVQAFHEKVPNPPSNLANGAIYIFDHDVITFLNSINKEVIDLSTEVLPFFIGRINTYHNNDYLRDIGSPETLMQAEKEFTNLE